MYFTYGNHISSLMGCLNRKILQIAGYLTYNLLCFILYLASCIWIQQKTWALNGAPFSAYGVESLCLSQVPMFLILYMRE